MRSGASCPLPSLQYYTESLHTAPNTTAMPEPDQALELYREVAMVGAVVERELARERIVDIARERQRVFNNPPPVLMGGPVAPAAEGNKHAVNLPDQTLSRLDATRCFVSEFVDGEEKMREKT